jgi:hypothetical protein
MSASQLRTLHAVLTVVWLIIIPVAVVTHLLWSLPFISAISIYANVAGHFSSWQAARAEEAAEE